MQTLPNSIEPSNVINGSEALLSFGMGVRESVKDHEYA